MLRLIIIGLLMVAVVLIVGEGVKWASEDAARTDASHAQDRP